MMTVVPISKAPGWSPTPFQAPAIRPRLAQTVITTPVTPPGAVVPGAAPRPAFIDSALVSFIFDALGATAYGILSYGAKSVKATNWSLIFGGLSFLLAGKALYDLGNVRER